MIKPKFYSARLFLNEWRELPEGIALNTQQMRYAYFTEKKIQNRFNEYAQTATPYCTADTNKVANQEWNTEFFLNPTPRVLRHFFALISAICDTIV